MLAQRIRRSEETSPWTSPVHKIRTSFDLNRQDARNLAVAFDKTEKGHFSFDVSFPATPIKSLAAAIGGKGMEYAAGDANQCDLFNPVVTTSINGHQWFHGSLAEGAVRLKNGVNAPMFTVNWFLPPAPKSTKDVTPRKVRKALVDHVQEKSPATMAIEVDVTTSVGSKACPNLPIIPASIFPAYACADSYQTCANQPLRSMADAPFAGEYYLGEPQFSAEDAFIEDDFVDEDAAGEFAFGDELDEDALDEDSAAEYALGDELLDADFSLSEEDFADEEGLDEADFSAEDALFADNSADTYAASYADSTLFE
ncbi:hypothetical protein BCR44DRAFT_59029 [Catenaria anguillulae PL171]|uniref:Uncharacterized protein n=1 Tax=Catenaria anguillulae PL171 TaxID=765915 RepID=A0A1Y2HZ42_9FUNG|nr:hypothetical protein BCR44DRAFT_59029 [Catenaria anguillulae PL171]